MLKLTVGRQTVQFVHSDDAMTVSWDVSASLEGAELLDKLRRIVAFMDAQEGREALPQRVPGATLIPVTEEEGMAMKKTHPGSVTNGWAAYAGSVPAQPEIPEDRKNEWEMIPPGEQA